ncbi:MAG: hypothetical protein DWQ10_17925 [Calditrichaeota bacterium]|nr:MAG: hypothetical protein DWQ10_17925 [Calditrichota bacterium]
MRVLNNAFDNPLEPEENASMHFAGGIMQYGYQCGMIWGAALAAGAQAYQLYGAGSQAETSAVNASQKVVESFRTCNTHINCSEITELDKSSSNRDLIVYFLIKGGSIGCLRRSAQYAPLALNEIKSAFSEKSMDATSSPVSCAAMLAKKMGLSDMHTVMVSGFAGGIGLCGGACGALGAAIWIISMNNSKKENGKIDFNNPKAIEIIERFLESADYEFECSDIVGRKFENIEDHATYLREGGCSKIIEVLAAESSTGLKT